MWPVRFKVDHKGRTSSLGTGGMTGALGLRSVRYMALESSSSDGGTFSFRCRSNHWMEEENIIKILRHLSLYFRFS